LAKWFCGKGFAWGANAARSFFCVPAVIAASATVASPAASKPDSVSGVAPTADINRVRKDGSIIVTGNGNTDSAGRKLA